MCIHPRAGSLAALGVAWPVQACNMTCVRTRAEHQWYCPLRRPQAAGVHLGGGEGHRCAQLRVCHPLHRHADQWAGWREWLAARTLLTSASAPSFSSAVLERSSRLMPASSVGLNCCVHASHASRQAPVKLCRQHECPCTAPLCTHPNKYIRFWWHLCAQGGSASSPGGARARRAASTSRSWRTARWV